MDVQELFDALHTLGSPWQLPYHVVRRVHMMLAGETPLYVDGVWSEHDDRLLYGTILCVTESAFVAATLSGAGDPDRYPSRSSSVTVTRVPTSSVRSVTVGGVRDENSDDAWARAPADDVLPLSCAVEIYFETADAITLPLASRPGRDLRALVVRVIATAS